MSVVAVVRVPASNPVDEHPDDEYCAENDSDEGANEDGQIALRLDVNHDESGDGATQPEHQQNPPR